MKKFWLSCLILFCSCVPLHAYNFTYINSPHPMVMGRVQKVYVDNAFGNDIVSIQDALNQWQYALHGYIIFDMQVVDVVHGSLEPMKDANAGKAWIFLKIDSNNALVSFQDRTEFRAFAFVEKIGGNTMYVVRDRINDGNVRGLVMHEVGHLLGAEHRKGQDNLMNPFYYDYDTQCVDKLTLEQVAKYQHIPIDNMNYCVYLNDGVEETVIVKYIN
jgi:hypothetical protein